MLSGTLKEIVDRAGGVAALAIELEISPKAIYRWREVGVPRDRVAELSRLTGIDRSDIEKISRGLIPPTKSKKAWEL
jgi:hypothetical protein